MSQYQGPIRRIDTAKSHYYVDANRQRVPGVTTLLNGVPKPKLIDWAGNATAAYAIDNWDELSGLSPSKRLERLKKGRYEESDKAKDRGTEVHELAAHLAQGESVDIPELIAGHVGSYVQFLDEFDPEPKLIEVTVSNLKYGYAGTLDSVFYFPTLDKTLLCDIKTNKTGIFGETALQLAGYRYAEVYIDEAGAEQPMPEVDGCAAIHVTPNGYYLVPVTAGQAEFRQLLYAAEMYRFEKNSRELVGKPLTPPTQLTRRRLEIVHDIEGVPA